MVAHRFESPVGSTDAVKRPVLNAQVLVAAVGLLLLTLAFVYRWLPDDARRPAAMVAGIESPTLPEGLSVAVEGLASDEPDAPAAQTATGSETPAEAAAEQKPARELNPEQRARLTELLNRAGEAEEQGRLLEPEDDSAAEWFARALEVDPGDPSANDGLQRVLSLTVAAADDAIDRGDLRAAEPVFALLAPYPSVAPELERLAARVAAAPSVEALLREGARRMAQGQRFAPQGASALDSYRTALAIDPRNRVAREGLNKVQEAMAAAVIEAAGGDRFDDADALLARSAELGADTPVHLAAEQRMAAFRERRAASLIDAARASLGTRDVDSAAQFAAGASALAPATPGLGELEARIAAARQYGGFQPGENFSDGFVTRQGRGPELVVLPLGEFEMGSPERERDRRENEGPQFKVRFERAFALARNEVSVAEFRDFIESSGWRTTAEVEGRSSIYDQRSGRMLTRRGVDWRRDYAGEPARDAEPVVHVSWADAHAYGEWLVAQTGKRYRLPTEAEFEYALRAGSTTRWSWGNQAPEQVIGNFTGLGDRSTRGRAWSRGFEGYNDGYWGPAPVGSFAPNAFGLADLDGNVAEWVEDCWHDSYLRAPTDGSAWVNRGCARRVIRGGSWGSTPDQLRSAWRTSGSETLRSGRTGFRVAREL